MKVSDRMVAVDELANLIKNKSIQGVEDEELAKIAVDYAIAFKRGIDELDKPAPTDFSKLHGRTY